MTDSSIPDIPAFADELSPLERAELGLQNELSVFEIGQLTYPKENTHSKRKQLTDYLLKAIKGGQLAAYGDPDGWPAIEISWPSDHTEHRYPRCDGHKGSIVPDYSQFGGLYRGSHNPFDPFSDYDRPYKPRTHWRTQYEGDWCLVTRADYLAFVESPAAHGIPFPDSWKSSQGEPAPLSQSKPDKPEQGAEPTRKIALLEAEYNALAMLRKELRREPDFEEFWDYITRHDNTGTIADNTDDILMWIGKGGQSCKTTKSTMRNRLTAAKKRNPFNL